MAKRKLATHVHVRHDGEMKVFGPDDDVPDEVAAKITNPDAWAEPPDPEPQRESAELESAEREPSRRSRARRRGDGTGEA